MIQFWPYQGYQINLFALKQQTNDACYLQTKLFCQKTSQAIIKPNGAASALPGIGNHGAFTSAEPIRWQTGYLIGWYIHQRYPVKLAWVNNGCL